MMLCPAMLVKRVVESASLPLRCYVIVRLFGYALDGRPQLA
jgi:hypothetical protein